MIDLDRTPKPCLHPKANHQHGMTVTYNRDGCRCIPCYDANRKYQLRLSYDLSQGKSRMVDGTEARAHLQTLRAGGMGMRRIAEVSGINYRAVRRFFDGSRTGKIAKKTNESILGVTLNPYPHARVSGLGTGRRLQALMCAGWTSKQLAEHSGVSYHALGMIAAGKQRNAEQFVVDRIRETFNQLWDVKPPASTPTQRQKAQLARKRAQANGWVPAFAWEEDEWDDPNAAPDLGESVDESYVDEIAVFRCLYGDDPPAYLTKRERYVAVEQLRERGFSLTEIAARMGIDDRQVSRAVYALRQAV